MIGNTPLDSLPGDWLFEGNPYASDYRVEMYPTPLQSLTMQIGVNKDF